jgi:hypothetical protein
MRDDLRVNALPGLEHGRGVGAEVVLVDLADFGADIKGR